MPTRHQQGNEYVDQKAAFKKPEGLHYTKFLKKIHADTLFEWYMEIGCRDGRSFAPVRGNTIAVDPFFRIRDNLNIIGVKPSLQIFQTTSDVFFENKFLKRANIQLSFSFLDGMHLIEYLLRDFINTEELSNPNGVIAIHDCCPFNYNMTTRDYVNRQKGSGWTGDVWKILPILADFRPDLEVTVLDAAPTGLVLVRELDPQSTVLRDKYNEIVAAFVDLTLEEYGLENFYKLFDFQDTLAALDATDTLFGSVRINPNDLEVPEYSTP